MWRFDKSGSVFVFYFIIISFCWAQSELSADQQEENFLSLSSPPNPSPVVVVKHRCKPAISDNNGTFVCPVGFGFSKAGCSQAEDSLSNRLSGNEADENATTKAYDDPIAAIMIVKLDCVACRHGFEFSETEDSFACHLCSKCSEGAVQSWPCNATHDTECHCPRGTFSFDGRCKTCDLCPHGQGVAKQCTETQNTACRKCPAGTYSGVLSGTRDCALCTVCKDDQLMLQECNRIQDTICIDKNSHKRHQFPPPDSRATLQPEGGDIVSRYEAEEIPVYCTILVPIGLGLLAYFLLRWRLRKPSAKTRNVMRDADCATAAVYRQDALLLGGVPAAALQKRSDQMKLHINHLSTKKRHDVEVALNVHRLDERDWRALAKHLGYPIPKIVSFAQQGSVSNRGPTYHLFADWSLRPDATVHLLSQSLVEIGRIDVLWMLQPTCEKMFPPYSGGEIV